MYSKYLWMLWDEIEKEFEALNVKATRNY